MRNKNPIVRAANTLRHKKWRRIPKNNLIHNQRDRICKLLRGERKYNHTTDLIGCDGKVLKKFVQNQFRLNMTWDNYGEWHIDHIRPCASFDLTKKEEQYRCFHYTNLQSLWAAENLSKGFKYDNNPNLIFVEYHLYYH